MSTPGQFAKRVGVSVKTIQKCDRLGILPAKRTITNRRYYIDEELVAPLSPTAGCPVKRKNQTCRTNTQR